MGGCFGPRRNKTLVYIDLLDQIYSEAFKVEIPNAGVQPYDIIRDKLTKKGLLKKLVEHLSSHRNYLDDCAQTNYRMMNDLNSPKARVTGLIVSNTLIKNLEAFELVNLQPRLASHGVLAPIVQTQTNLKGQVLIVGTGVDFRFQNIYFRQVIDLYDNQPQLREKVLQGISEFSIHKQGKFTCDRLVVAMLTRLRIDIQENRYFLQCCKTFGDLLSKSNDNIEDPDNSSQSLTLFLNIWVHSQEEIILFYCENVIRAYLSRCITSRDYSFVYAAVFLLYDYHHFQEAQLSGLQNKLIQIVSQDDMKIQFLKGMFKYLLTYMSVTANHELMISRWQLGVYSVHYETLKMRYKNILSRQNKINSLKTLYRWINMGHLNLNELIVFNRDTLVSCFIFNIFSSYKDADLLKIIIRSFYSICNRCEATAVCMIFEFLVEEVFRINNISLDPGSIIIRVCCEVLKKYRLMDFVNPDDVSTILKPLDAAQPHRTRLEILYMYDVILKECTTPLGISLIDTICKMIQSLYDSFTAKTQTLSQKYMSICSMYTIFVTLYVKGQTEILMHFARRLQNHQEHIVNPFQRYLEKYFMLELDSLLERYNCIPNQMRQINRLIALSDKRAEIEILNFISRSSALWTSRAGQKNITSKHQQLSGRKYEYIERQFDKYGNDQGLAQIVHSQFEIQIQDRTKNSIVSENIRGDDSIEQIFGMIRSGGGQQIVERSSFRKKTSRERMTPQYYS